MLQLKATLNLAKKSKILPATSLKRADTMNSESTERPL